MVRLIIPKFFRGNTLLKDSVIYTFGALFQRGIGYFLIPVYMSVLATSEFGKYEFLNTLALLLSILCSVGLPQVIFSEFYHTEGGQKIKLFNNIVVSYLIFSIPCFTIFFLFFLFLGNSIFKIQVSSFCIIFTFLYSFLLFFQSIFFSALRLSFRSLEFAIMNIINGILLGGVNLLLVYFFRCGIAGILFTSCLITGATSMVAYLKFRKKTKLQLKILPVEVKALITMGLPFMISSLAHWVATFADRWIILKTLSLSDLGVYSVAFKFSSIYDPLVIAPLLAAYTPHLFKKFSQNRYYIPYHIIIPAIIFAFGGFIFISNFALTLCAKGKPDYLQSMNLVPFLVMAYAFSFISQLSASVLIYLKRTKQLVYNILTAGIVNISLNLTLIRIYGLKGSAYAFLSSYIIWAVLTLLQSIFAIRWAKNKLITQ